MSFYFPPVGGRTANGRPYGSTVLEHPNIVGASIARPLRTDIRPVILEKNAFAFAFCFTLPQIYTGGRPMAAPTGGGFKIHLSFRKWKCADYLRRI